MAEKTEKRIKSCLIFQLFEGKGKKGGVKFK